MSCFLAAVGCILSAVWLMSESAVRAACPWIWNKYRASWLKYKCFHISWFSLLLSSFSLALELEGWILMWINHLHGKTRKENWLKWLISSNVHFSFVHVSLQMVFLSAQQMLSISARSLVSESPKNRTDEGLIIKYPHLLKCSTLSIWLKRSHWARSLASINHHNFKKLY